MLENLKSKGKNEGLRTEAKALMVETMREAGEILMRYFGREHRPRIKENQSSIVTDADLASEAWVVARIRERFPTHSIVAEESGYARRESVHTWVIDPLDGTSNFAAGLPWFGVQAALLEAGRPLLAAMYLPVSGTLYYAERGKGVQRDGRNVRVTRAARLDEVLCAVGVDANSSPKEKRQQLQVLSRVGNRVRNIRATNCLVDFCYTIDGRLGGCLNFNTKIWDIAPVCLMLPEAGGRVTDVSGKPIRFRLTGEPFDRTYTILGSSRRLYSQLCAAVGVGRSG